MYSVVLPLRAIVHGVRAMPFAVFVARCAHAILDGFLSQLIAILRMLLFQSFNVDSRYE